MKENIRKSTISVVQNGPWEHGDEYKVLVPIQDSKQFDLLLPPAIDLAKKRHGRVILLNIIEIPYQLPPSRAKKFVSDRELMLDQGLKMLKRAEFKGSKAVRIAHDTNNAITRFSKDENVNMIIRENDLEVENETIFNGLKDKIKSWL